MALTFLLGRAGSGKSEYCIRRAVECEEAGKRVLMIVPEQYSHQGESAFLREKGYIYDDFNVTSFARLSKKLIADSGRKRVFLSDSGRAMLLFRAINACKSKLSFFHDAAEKSGYLNLLQDAISELKRGEVTPELLKNASQKTKEHLLSAKLLDLSYIYEAYNNLLADDRADKDDDLTLAASLCLDSAYIKGAEIFIDEFFRFTQNELVFIGACLSAGANVTVSLTMPDETVPEYSVFQSVANTKAALERIAKEAKSKILPPIILESTPRFKLNALCAFERITAGEKIASDASSTSLSLHIANGKYEEVVYLATSIRKFILKTGARYKDIAVITGDYDGYADLIQSVFPMYDIPVFLDNRLAFLNHPIVLFLFSLLDLVSGVSTKRVLAYMKSGFADILEEDAYRLENYALAGAIEYGDWLDDARFLQKASSVFSKEEENEEGKLLVDVKNHLLKPVLQLKENLQKSKLLGDRIACLLAFFDDIKLSSKIEERMLEFEAKGLLRLKDEYAEVFRILTETLSEMAHLLGDETAGISTVRAMLEAGLSEKSIGVIPTVLDQVSFGDLNRSVIKNVRALFVIGANDGLLPPLPSGSNLLSDAEREFLLSEQIFVAPDTKKRITDAEFTLYSALNTAREKLFISYPVSDEVGQGLRPAMLIAKLKRAFPALTVIHALDQEELSADFSVSSKQSAYSYVVSHINELSENKTAQALYDILEKDAQYKESLDRARKFASYQNVAGRLSGETVKALYGTDLYGSVSKFERFSACPFSFFIQYGLKAKERTVLKVEAPDIGSLLHEIIERFSLTMKTEGKSYRTITKEEQAQITDAIIEELFGAMFIKNIYSAGRLEALKKRLKSLVAKSVWAICEHVKRGEFEPTAFEIAFDKNGELPPVTVSLPMGYGTVTMRGRIDRIDTLSHEGKLYLKIIDYKSGSKGYSLADIFNGTTLQLAVYMLAAKEGFSKDAQASFGGMFYFRLDDPLSDSMPEEAVNEDALLKSFKMSGLSSDDPDIIRAIDGDASGWSLTIPVYVKADGTVSKSQSKTASYEEFETLSRYIKNTLSKIGKEIMSGNADIYPIRDGNLSPCGYCKFSAVCGFDPNVHPCRRPETFRDDAEIWEKMKE